MGGAKLKPLQIFLKVEIIFVHNVRGFKKESHITQETTEKLTGSGYNRKDDFQKRQ